MSPAAKHAVGVASTVDRDELEVNPCGETKRAAVGDVLVVAPAVLSGDVESDGTEGANYVRGVVQNGFAAATISSILPSPAVSSSIPVRELGGESSAEVTTFVGATGTGAVETQAAPTDAVASPTPRRLDGDLPSSLADVEVVERVETMEEGGGVEAKAMPESDLLSSGAVELGNVGNGGVPASGVLAQVKGGGSTDVQAGIEVEGWAGIVASTVEKTTVTTEVAATATEAVASVAVESIEADIKSDEKEQLMLERELEQLEEVACEGEASLTLVVDSIGELPQVDIGGGTLEEEEEEESGKLNATVLPSDNIVAAAELATDMDTKDDRGGADAHEKDQSVAEIRLPGIVVGLESIVPDKQPGRDRVSLEGGEDKGTSIFKVGPAESLSGVSPEQKSKETVDIAELERGALVGLVPTGVAQSDNGSRVQPGVQSAVSSSPAPVDSSRRQHRRTFTRDDLFQFGVLGPVSMDEHEDDDGGGFPGSIDDGKNYDGAVAEQEKIGDIGGSTSGIDGTGGSTDGKDAASSELTSADENRDIHDGKEMPVESRAAGADEREMKMVVAHTDDATQENIEDSTTLETADGGGGDTVTVEPNDIVLPHDSESLSPAANEKSSSTLLVSFIPETTRPSAILPNRGGTALTGAGFAAVPSSHVPEAAARASGPDTLMGIKVSEVVEASLLAEQGGGGSVVSTRSLATPPILMEKLGTLPSVTCAKAFPVSASDIRSTTSITDRRDIAANDDTSMPQAMLSSSTAIVYTAEGVLIESDLAETTATSSDPVPTAEKKHAVISGRAPPALLLKSQDNVIAVLRSPLKCSYLAVAPPPISPLDASVLPRRLPLDEPATEKVVLPGRGKQMQQSPINQQSPSLHSAATAASTINSTRGQMPRMKPRSQSFMDLREDSMTEFLFERPPAEAAAGVVGTSVIEADASGIINHGASGNELKLTADSARRSGVIDSRSDNQVRPRASTETGTPRRWGRRLSRTSDGDVGFGGGGGGETPTFPSDLPGRATWVETKGENAAMKQLGSVRKEKLLTVVASTISAATDRPEREYSERGGKRLVTAVAIPPPSPASSSRTRVPSPLRASLSPGPRTSRSSRQQPLAESPMRRASLSPGPRASFSSAAKAEGLSLSPKGRNWFSPPGLRCRKVSASFTRPTRGRR